MSIDSITAASGGIYSAAAVEASAAKDPSVLDKQAFLELLIAQLSNQDPSKPMDSDSLMTQTSQMASMEALTELSTTQRESFALQMRANAAGMVGQQVSYLGTDGVSTVSGTATGVSFGGAVPTVVVDGTEIALDKVSAVSVRPAVRSVVSPVVSPVVTA